MESLGVTWAHLERASIYIIMEIGGPADPVHDEMMRHCLGGPPALDWPIEAPLDTTNDD